MIGQYGRDHHEHQGDGIAVVPPQLGHVLEVHAIDRADQGRRDGPSSRVRSAAPAYWLAVMVGDVRPPSEAQVEPESPSRLM